jgi:RNA polymerase sigma-70 factor (ECF subfamily)
VEEPDEGVIRAAMSGDSAAFEVLVRHYEAPVRRFLRHLLGDEALAEDVAQEAFVRAYRGLPTYAHRSSFSSWLFQVARNAAIDEQRSRARRDRLVAAVTPLRPEDAAAQVSAPDTATEVGAALASLDRKHREALLAVEVFGLTYAEAAVVLGTAEGTVKSRVHHARRALSRWLTAEEPARDL